MDWKLKPGETLLWEGRPEISGPGLYPAVSPGRRIVAMVFFGAMALLMVAALARTLGRSPAGLAAMAMILAPVAFALWYVAGGKPRIDGFRRRRACYGLSDRQAMIATRWPWGWMVARHPRKRWGQIEWSGEAPGAVIFRRVSSGSAGFRQSLPVGFEAIRDAERVADLMRGLTARPGTDG